MAEIVIRDITGGNTLRNKQSLTVNGAGDSPQNPILRGLGMSIDLKIANVLQFETILAGITPVETAEEQVRLLMELVNTRQYRYRSAVGVAPFALNVNYAEAQQHFLLSKLYGSARIVGTERQFWVKDNPTIRMGFAVGSAAQSAWLARASESYVLEPGGAELAFDPGTPPVVGVDVGTSDSWYVNVGPDRVVEFAVWDRNQAVPFDIPIEFMPDWLDEFDQQHFGGAKYVSIFEEGSPEDVTGTYIDTQYQQAIAGVANIRIRQVDMDHEYRMVCRFRSAQDDSFYKDVLVRFRLITAEILNRQFLSDVYESDLPGISYNEGTGEYFWDGMTAFVASFSIASAQVMVDQQLVSLPLDDVTPFSALWATLRAHLYGGEVTVRFQRVDIPGATAENFNEVYLLLRDGTNVTVEKQLFRRYIHSGSATWAPDIQFRFVEPVNGTVYLEAINNMVDFKQVVVWTGSGTVNVPMPLRNGQQIDITSIVDVNPTTGVIENATINILMQTESTTRIYEIAPTVIVPVVRVQSADVGEDVIPTFDASVYPNLDVTFPALTDQGESYSILLGEPPAFADSVVFYGRKAMQVESGWVPGTPKTLLGVLTTVCHSSETVIKVAYRIQITSGVNSGEIITYVVEVPIWNLGYTGIPPTGLHPGDVQVILYGTTLVIVDKPTNLFTMTITGNLGSWLQGAANLLKNHWYDISAYIDGGAPSLALEYVLLDADNNPVSYGPFTVPRFTPNPVVVLTTTYPVNGDVWNTGRLLEIVTAVPRAYVNTTDKKVKFDLSGGRYTDWVRFKVTNPHDGSSLRYDFAPGNGVEWDIAPLFRGDPPFELEVGQRLLVTFLHNDGPHVSVLYEIANEWVEGANMNDMRGLL